MPLICHPKPWLNQGDIFSTLAIPTFDEGNRTGPAVLASHGCALDKRNGRGRSTITHLSFLPVHDATMLDASRSRLLRNNSLKPYAALYLGEVTGIGEAYANLGEPFSLPASHFGVEMGDFTEQLHGDPDPYRLLPRSNDTRVATLAPDQTELFLQKWRAHWTGAIQG